MVIGMSIYMSVRYASSGGTTVDTLNYNLYYTLDDDNYIISNLEEGNYKQSQWSTVQGMGYETNSPDPAFPCFVDSINNLHLKISSPAVGKAKPVSFVNTDIEGNPRDPDHPCIGAYEYQDPSNISNKKRANFYNYVLKQNYPNPFNPITTINYTLKEAVDVKLVIFNILGQEIQTLVNKFQKSGDYSINFNVKNLSSGIYFYKLQVGDKITKTKKMILMR